MIECTPTSLLLWEFELQGDGHRGTTKMGWIREQGAITADGEEFAVRKHGVMSGQWSLEQHGQVVASALKGGMFTRTFEVTGRYGTFVLRAPRFFTRRFVIETAGQPVATVRPVSIFTRRAVIEVERPETPFPAVVFMLWLVLVTWRRTRRRD